jgi:serine kinase of HPr protein (carbohydrate metabolism regulator)
MRRSPAETLTVHATAVALDGLGVLLRGAPGSGKSDLALRLIDAGARLIADDQTTLVRRGDALLASPPATIAGRLEVRGLGLMALAHVADVPLAAVFDLVGAGALERLPEPATVEILNILLPLIRLDPTVPSAAAKVRLAVHQLRGDKMAPP